MSSYKSSSKVGSANCSTFAKRVFFNHTMNVFPQTSISFCDPYKTVPVCSTNDFLQSRHKYRWLPQSFPFLTKFVDWQCGQFVIFLGSIIFLTCSFWLTEVKKTYLSASDKFSKSCFKMSNSFVTPDIIKYKISCSSIDYKKLYQISVEISTDY